MSQLQQVSPWLPGIQERYDDSAKAWIEARQAILVAEIFRQHGLETRVPAVTPPGYRYVREALTEPLLAEVSGPVMQIAAHPGDGPDFFYATYLKMAAHLPARTAYHEVLLTDGEAGVEGWHPERTRQVRVEEAYAGAELVGSRLHFLSYPDGKLATLPDYERKRLIERLAEKIATIQPALVIVHPPKNDHPDHAYSFLLTLEALQLNAQAGGRLPALYIHDVEFGLQQESLWASPTSDQIFEAYPMHIPDLLIDISTTHAPAQCALQKHQTQMYDPILKQPKLYASLIDALAELRGLACEAADTLEENPRAQGFSQVVISGVTNEQPLLSWYVPSGSSYRLRKETDTVSAKKALLLCS